MVTVMVIFILKGIHNVVILQNTSNKVKFTVP